jgi:hypothetical protein
VLHLMARATERLQQGSSLANNVMYRPPPVSPHPLLRAVHAAAAAAVDLDIWRELVVKSDMCIIYPREKKVKG